MHLAVWPLVQPNQVIDRVSRYHRPMRSDAIACVAWVLFACGGGASEHDARATDGLPPPDAETPSFDGPLPDALPLDCTPAAGTSLALQQVIPTTLVQPVAITAPSGDPRLFIAERPGRIRIVRDGAVLAMPFLDLRDSVYLFSEMGLLGLAFHPDYATNGRFFVYYNEDVDPDEPGHIANTVIAEYQVSTDPDVAAPTERRLRVIAQPAGNHNGGHIAFGPDGYLYIGLGDGGANRLEAQRLSSPLGAMLRIDVDAGEPYGIPPDNPFAGITVLEQATWIYGLRNPWRWSFDRLTGDLYVGDVGAAQREEVSVKLAGSAGGDNFGWPVYEGDLCLDGPCDQPDAYVAPITSYDHSSGRCVVVGGYVYRGACMPDVQGWYFYADHCTAEIWKFELAGGMAGNLVDLSADLDSTNLLSGLTTFGEDARGELYVTNLAGNLYRIVLE